MFVDDVTIKVRAGDGGAGRVAFQKVKQSLGPTGASGGNGADVYLEGVSDIGALSQFRNKKDFHAQDGEVGHGQFRDGANGEDLALKVPVGTIVHNLDTSVDRELLKVGQRLLVARGGRGGKGNFHFRSSTNTTPEESGPGRPGEGYTLRLELQLIADVGLVGLPNAGKSSLLNVLTKASARVANYPFTTLEPNLGAYYNLVIADIPGLIEGASQGKGLGVKFLRHVSRTRVLFHLVSAESTDPASDYQTVRKELRAFDPALLEKREYLFLTKVDVLSKSDKTRLLGLLRKTHDRVAAISVFDETSLSTARKILDTLAKDKRL